MGLDNRYWALHDPRGRRAETSAVYFDQAAEAIVGLLDRATFEQRLRAHFRNRNPNIGQDPAWYALRNTIYAAGCRISIAGSANPSAHAEANIRAWRYFQNALSVHVDLLGVRSDTANIEALAVMVC